MQQVVTLTANADVIDPILVNQSVFWLSLAFFDRLGRESFRCARVNRIIKTTVSNPPILKIVRHCPIGE